MVLLEPRDSLSNLAFILSLVLYLLLILVVPALHWKLGTLIEDLSDLDVVLSCLWFLNASLLRWLFGLVLLGVELEFLLLLTGLVLIQQNALIRNQYFTTFVALRCLWSGSLAACIRLALNRLLNYASGLVPLVPLSLEVLELLQLLRRG